MGEDIRNLPSGFRIGAKEKIKEKENRIMK